MILKGLPPLFQGSPIYYVVGTSYYESKFPELDLSRTNQEKDTFFIYTYTIQKSPDIDTTYLIILCSTILQ